VTLKIPNPLKNFIEEKDKLISLYAPAGAGSSTLLVQCLREYARDKICIFFDSSNVIDPKIIEEASLDNILLFQDNDLDKVIEASRELNKKDISFHLFVDDISSFTSWNLKQEGYDFVNTRTLIKTFNLLKSLKNIDKIVVSSKVADFSMNYARSVNVTHSNPIDVRILLKNENGSIYLENTSTKKRRQMVLEKKDHIFFEDLEDKFLNACEDKT